MTEILLGISLVSYMLFMVMIGIAYIAFLITTSRDERNEFEAGVSDYIMAWIIMTWPITGLPVVITADDDNHISSMEVMFIIFEITFWVPLIIFFVLKWV